MYKKCGLASNLMATACSSRKNCYWNSNSNFFKHMFPFIDRLKMMESPSDQKKIITVWYLSDMFAMFMFLLFAVDKFSIPIDPKWRCPFCHGATTSSHPFKNVGFPMKPSSYWGSHPAINRVFPYVHHQAMIPIQWKSPETRLFTSRNQLFLHLKVSRLARICFLRWDEAKNCGMKVWYGVTSNIHIQIMKSRFWQIIWIAYVGYVYHTYLMWCCVIWCDVTWCDVMCACLCLCLCLCIYK